MCVGLGSKAVTTSLSTALALSAYRRDVKCRLITWSKRIHFSGMEEWLNN